MSAHARLATIAAAQAAMAELLRRVGHQDASTTHAWYDRVECQVRAYVPIGDEPVNGANEVLAVLVASCSVGKRAKVAACAEHRLTQDQHSVCWANLFRFQTPGGAAWMAPRTLAPMILEAMKH